MIIPELPEFLTQLGGAQYKGLIISLFTLTAGLSRPFSGKLSDTIGRRPVIVIGAVVCIFCSSLYPVLSGVSAFLFLRLIHGFSTGFTPTAITAYVADIVPDAKRGEAMGIAGVSMNLGASMSPPFGSYLAVNYSLDVMFFGSALLGLISLALVSRLSETLKNRQTFTWSHLKIKRNEIIDKSAINPALVCGLCYMGFGVVLTIVPDQCAHLGMTNKGLFFTSITVCSVLSRLVAGQLSDIYGRIFIMRVSIVILVAAYLSIAFVTTPTQLLAATGFLGFAIGMAIPGVFAWTVDRSHAHSRGQAFATIFIGLEFAIGIGALMGAAIYQSTPENFATSFYIVSFITCFALLYAKEGKYGQEMKVLTLDE